jgi:hypothetical protein
MGRIVCEQTNINRLICKCKKHEAQQTWFKTFYKSKEGKNNFRAWANARTKLTINTNLSTFNSEQKGPANNNVTINGCIVGRTSCPSEILSVLKPDGNTVRVQIHYDGGSQHTLANQHVHPVVISTRMTEAPIELLTVEGNSRAKREVATIKLTDKIQLEALIMKNMNIASHNVHIPKEWEQYRENWVDNRPINGQLTAQILLRSDFTMLHPSNVINEQGQPIQTKHARLMVSAITGRYILHGWTNENAILAPCNWQTIAQREDNEQNDWPSTESNRTIARIVNGTGRHDNIDEYDMITSGSYNDDADISPAEIIEASDIVLSIGELEL